MVNSRANGSKILLYDSGTLTTDSSNTMTKTLSKTVFKSFELHFSGLVAAALELEMIIDGDTGTKYAASGATYAGNGDRTSLQEAAQASFPIINATLLNAANNEFHTIMHIYWSDSDTDTIFIDTESHQLQSILSQKTIGQGLGVLTTANVIASILIETSTSTWTGSWQVYGIPV